MKCYYSTLYKTQNTLTVTKKKESHVFAYLELRYKTCYFIKCLAAVAAAAVFYR
jgi:hypothetical protein